MVGGFVPTYGNFEVIDANGAIVPEDQTDPLTYQKEFAAFNSFYLVMAYLKMQAWTSYGADTPEENFPLIYINGVKIGTMPPQGVGSTALPYNFQEFVLPFGPEGHGGSGEILDPFLDKPPGYPDFLNNQVNITPPFVGGRWPETGDGSYIVVKNVICHFRAGFASWP